MRDRGVLSKHVLLRSYKGAVPLAKRTCLGAGRTKYGLWRVGRAFQSRTVSREHHTKSSRECPTIRNPYHFPFLETSRGPTFSIYQTNLKKEKNIDNKKYEVVPSDSGSTTITGSTTTGTATASENTRMTDATIETYATPATIVTVDVPVTVIQRQK